MSDRPYLEYLVHETVNILDRETWDDVLFADCHIIIDTKSDKKTHANCCTFNSCTFTVDGKDYDTDGFLALMKSVPTMTMTVTP